MANKKLKNRNVSKASENQQKRRVRILQIFFIVFSIMLILSMVLSLTR